MILKVERRSGEIITFDPSRIQKAIFAAAQSVGGKDVERSWFLTDQVVQHLKRTHDQQITKIEDIQDTVEKVLIENGHAQTSKAFILYRVHRAKVREQERQEILEKIKNHQAVVTLQDGTTASFQIEKIVESVTSAARRLTKVDSEAVVIEACKNLYSGLTIPEIEKAVINAARSRIEKHPQYSYLAARLSLQGIYKEVVGYSVYENPKELDRIYREQFAGYLKQGIAEELLDPRLQEFDVALLSSLINPERDELFEFRGVQTLKQRYLLRTSDFQNRIFELPQFMWMRVAMGVALAENPKEMNERAREFYNVISQMNYVPSTPTLFNSGTTHPQLSSCFLNTVDDSLPGIFKSYSDNAMLSKWAGGLGTDWTSVRSLGSKIKGTNGASQGIIPFLKIFNDVAIAVNQGGKRKGAMCAYLEIWHGDIEEFLEAKKNTGDERRRLHDVHTAVWVNDLFMKRVAGGGNWTLFSPSEVPDLHDLYGQKFENRYAQYEAQNLPSARTISATSLWRKLLTMLYETGHPWITFKDACNVRSSQSHVGVIHNSNLCTEITLNTSSEETAVCNLGSVNLSKMVIGGKINEKLIESTVKTAVRMLDNVIDINFYPTVEAKTANSRHRPIGLGVMGYQDVLYQLNIPFASEKNCDLADELMELVSYYAISASNELARERGTYESYPGSKWSQGLLPYDTMLLLQEERGVSLDYSRQQTKDWSILRESIKASGMRNSNCMAIAPTATISNISGTTPCIEPSFRNIYVKENTDGTFIVVNEYMVSHLETLNLWNDAILNQIKLNNGSLAGVAGVPEDLKDLYREAFEISPEWVIKTAARRAKWIDQSASTNIFIKTESGKVLDQIYTMAWKLGLKTTYYLRSLSTSSVEKNIDGEGLPAAPSQAIAAEKSQASLCKIDDPTCEVCQ